MRVALLVALVVAVAAVDIGRPLPLHNKLAHRRMRLGDGLSVAGSVSKAEVEALEQLRVAAAEREGVSLADQFATDLEAHVAAKAAAKAAAKSEAEAVAGMDVEVEAAAGEAVTADIVDTAETVIDADVAQAAEGVAEEAAEQEQASGLSIEALQELEYSKSTRNANAKAVGGKKSTLRTDKQKWENCLAAPAKGTKGAGQSKLSAVTMRAAPPLRDQAFVVEIDGTYQGPDVTYGSVTLQIARVSSTEPQAVDLPELVYRHSIVLKDVLQANPFTAKDALSATMYVPNAAFNEFAPSGEYVLTVVFTNQDKAPFACTKVNFSLN
jgi:hypothetical protein